MTQWIDETIPFSERFEDTYYSKLDGMAETDHVFIHCNELPDRWRSRDQFTIAELGFGTGLNFLRTMQRWRETADPGAALNYISFERFPLTHMEITKALSRWHALENETQELLEFWEPNNPNSIIKATFSCGINLEILLADANLSLPDCSFYADAWYLDGFAPSKNPQLWNEDLMKSVFDKTKPGGTFATYTAAGFVRRNLVNSGFQVRKVPGFGTKREMLCGLRAL